MSDPSAPATAKRGKGRNRGRRPRKPVVVSDPEPVAHSDQASDDKPAPSSRGNASRGRGRGNRRKNRKKTPAALKGEAKKEGEQLPATSSSTVQHKIPKKSTRKMLTTEQTQHLTEQLRKGEYECMVCMDRLGKKAMIWNCTKCYAIFHIGCIQKWSNASNEGSQHSWACPGCRTEVKGKVKARCFCGKVTKPKYDPYLVPHSCGEVCKRKRGGNCPHKCTQICHPGSCPPCAAMGETKKCFCEKTAYRLRCGEMDNGRSCSDVCGKLLNCTLHRCKEICHEGDCKPCDITMDRSCYCGEVRKELFCGEGTLSISGDYIGYYSCAATCNRDLSCGNHKCTLSCHPGDCPPCESGLHIKTCYCGAASQSGLLETPRTSCLDPIPVCHSICEKTLSCGTHTCKQLCHSGNCPPCTETAVADCRCGVTKQKLPCCELYPNGTSRPKEILCQTPCQAKRLCGRHRCRTVCCPMYQIGAEAHPCMLECGKKLSCKYHTCKKECHRGPCPPCLEASFDELSCRCGKTVIYPPIPCGTTVPECEHMCDREHPCEHPPQHNCHMEDECPKCYALTQKLCGCGNKTMTTKCYVEFPCCGDLCKKPLKCGIHVCQRACHGGLCEDEAIGIGESCGNLCLKEIPTCEHKCQSPCHPGEDCPLLVCQKEVTLRCSCGNNTEKGICNRGGSDNLFENDDYVRLECTDECVAKIRKQQLAVAFGRAEDGADVVPNYSMFLLNAGVSCRSFVKKIEAQFIELIESNQPNVRFPPMNSYYRNIIHQLSEYYKLESVSFDYEPHRNVVVTKTLRSSVPNTTLTEVADRNPIPRQPGTGEGINREGKPASLLLYNLNDTIKTEHLNAALISHRGEFYIKWIDDESAVATFNSEIAMKQALDSLSQSSQSFDVSPIQESDIEDIFISVAKKKEVIDSKAAEIALAEEEKCENTTEPQIPTVPDENIPTDWTEHLEESKDDLPEEAQ